MPRALTRLVLGLVAVFAVVTSDSRAQITAIPGSGCPGMPNPNFTGQPRLGMRVSCGCPPSIDRMRVLVGTRGPRIALPQSIMCVAGCQFDMQLILLSSTPSFTLAIPNNPTLIGGVVVEQCLQTSLNRPCLLLTPAFEIKIQP